MLKAEVLFNIYWGKAKHAPVAQGQEITYRMLHSACKDGWEAIVEHVTEIEEEMSRLRSTLKLYREAPELPVYLPTRPDWLDGQIKALLIQAEAQEKQGSRYEAIYLAGMSYGLANSFTDSDLAQVAKIAAESIKKNCMLQVLEEVTSYDQD